MNRAKTKQEDNMQEPGKSKACTTRMKTYGNEPETESAAGGE